MDDPSVDDMWRAAIEIAFVGQDKPMLEQQQRMMGSRTLDEMDPVMASADVAATRARRIVEKLIAEEAEGATPRPDAEAPCAVETQGLYQAAVRIRGLRRVMTKLADGLTLEITSRTMLTPDIVRIDLARADGGGLLPFTAGAHIDILIDDGLVRQYSLCNPPAERHRYQIAVLREPQSRGGGAGGRICFRRHPGAAPLDMSVALASPGADTRVYVCGPTAFMDSVREKALRLG